MYTNTRITELNDFELDFVSGSGAFNIGVALGRAARIGLVFDVGGVGAAVITVGLVAAVDYALDGELDLF